MKKREDFSLSFAIVVGIAFAVGIGIAAFGRWRRLLENDRKLVAKARSAGFPAKAARVQIRQLRRIK